MTEDRPLQSPFCFWQIRYGWSRDLMTARRNLGAAPWRVLHILYLDIRWRRLGIHLWRACAGDRSQESCAQEYKTGAAQCTCVVVGWRYLAMLPGFKEISTNRENFKQENKHKLETFLEALLILLIKFLILLINKTNQSKANFLAY